MRVKTEVRREAILAAATQLFQEMGYERSTMSELANRYGGSKATLYGYFRSKEELFVAVVRASSTSHLSEAVNELTQTAGASCQDSIDMVLMRFAERMLQVLVNDESALAMYRMVIAEAGRSGVGQLFYEAGPSESIAVLAELFAKAMVSAELRQADPHIMAQQFLALVTAEVEVRFFQQNPEPMDISQIRQLATRAVEMFLLGAAKAK